MEREYQFVQDLNLQVKTGSPKPREIAKREIDEARLIPRAATRLWTNAEEPLAGDAFEVLVEVEDLAIVPLIEGPLRDEPQTAAMAMDLVTEQELKLRKRVLDRLAQWLDDKRLISEAPRVARYEERPPEIRVCDNAYLALRRLVHFGEDEFARVVDAHHFLQLTDAQRDEVIAKAKATKTWRRIQDPDSVPFDEAPPSSKPGTTHRK